MKSKLKIGFVSHTEHSSFAFPPPRLLLSGRTRPPSNRAVQACPAVNTHEKRIIEVLAPFSLQMRCLTNNKGGYDFHLVDQGTRIDADLISQFVSFMPREIWRNPKAPVVQITLPHIFVCDEPCYLTQLPAWASEDAANIPGQFISGRFPADVWPRSLNLSFEWSNLNSDFRMKRGSAVCYLLVETTDLTQEVSLVEASMTEDLKSYISKMDGVVKFTSGSFGLFDRARAVRPLSLLSEIEK